MIRPPSKRSGFTLVEMLVVIGIITILASVIGVVVSKARGTANKFQLSAQLQTIQVALDAYKTDFQAFPTTTLAASLPSTGDGDLNADGFRGARTLCKALMGQCPAVDGPAVGHDGKDGFGFTIVGRSGVAVAGSKPFGPYLNVDKFKVVNIATTDGTVVNSITYKQGDPIAGNTFDDRAVLLDANDSPILYWPCLNPQAPSSTPSFANAVAKPAAFAYVGIGHTTTAVVPAPSSPTTVVETNGTGAATYPQRFAVTATLGVPMYDAMDNGFWITGPVFRKLLGDTNADGEIDLSLNEKPAVVGKYILWSAGPDKLFGPDPKGMTDDVTNYQGE